ncbi:hypothetical protein [Candidatus Methylacidithermus pantelleriae]|uniref:hypothetical protein n=1 Tax=Candidatus Methylacidithermus pantelleriae TaxID=2744239 RepID=UPI001BD2D6A0|nr:hypothetical protein [Candidatus Methylacidithermus pantelleriae]
MTQVKLDNIFEADVSWMAVRAIFPGDVAYAPILHTPSPVTPIEESVALISPKAIAWN